ncbi:MAG: hypothetical protein H7Z42_06490 [Roseiflexaceae bacterium]|nr:hypothetical protein [Roseiflexaceae bacterium]
MAHPGSSVVVNVDLGHSFQTIDGFGVNINSMYWHQPWNRILLETLIDDLGATLFRVDIFGKTNWPDPTGEIGLASLSPTHLASVYQSEVAQRGWGMIRYLNERGIAPYLTVSGDVPRWMLAADGATLADSHNFCELLLSLVDWARNREQLRFSLFGPLNETDLGSPEGPTVAPADYARIAAQLVQMMDAHGLGDVRLVLAEQGRLNTDYLRELARDESLCRAIGVVGMHCYSNYSAAQYSEIHDFVRGSALANARLWMTEFGDLDQTGEREWYVAWWAFSRLLDALEGGFQAALVWDAFDNYHDHDESWSIYGIMRTALKRYVPKKRYYALRQVFRHVRPGWVRVSVTSETPGLRVLGFATPDRTQFAIVGMNVESQSVHMQVQVTNFSTALPTTMVSYNRTSEFEDGVLVSQTLLGNDVSSYRGLQAIIPPTSIFTLST